MCFRFRVENLIVFKLSIAREMALVRGGHQVLGTGPALSSCSTCKVPGRRDGLFNFFLNRAGRISTCLPTLTIQKKAPTFLHIFLLFLFSSLHFRLVPLFLLHLLVPLLGKTHAMIQRISSRGGQSVVEIKFGICRGADGAQCD